MREPQPQPTLSRIMKEQSIPSSSFLHLTRLDFSNPGLGMPPATSSSVLRRRRDEGDTETLPPAAPNHPRAIWREAFHAVRAETERRAAPLSAEDQVVQSMPDASPAKWHRAHTTWFFEQFLLVPHLAGYRVFDAQFAYLFNSYYVAAGPRHARPRRGLITRPDCERVAAFRAHVDAGVERLLASVEDSQLAEVVRIVEIGLHHEQQHQELLLTDILHAFAQNPLAPTYAADWRSPSAPRAASEFAELPAGIRRIGFAGEGYSFDNEGPAHPVLLQPACIARGLVTNAQWLDFMADGGYATPSLWLSDGWALAEAEWEVAARANLLDDAFGIVWQWTRSAYLPYPGYRAAAGALGEYNGKFMINQMVLRGSSHATPAGHARASYRNFFYPSARWQISGLRLLDYLT